MNCCIHRPTIEHSSYENERTDRTKQIATIKTAAVPLTLACLLAILFIPLTSFAQATFQTGTNLGVQKIRLAAADFKASNADTKDAELLKSFNDTLWNDLDNAGIFEMVSKSFYPTQVPGQPTEVRFEQWNAPPPDTSMLAFGNLAANGDKVTVQAWLFDVKNTNSPQILGKQYLGEATTEGVRLIAHKFADEIIFRLGGGIPGIAETKIYYVSNQTGHKEIWSMDYDGADQHQLTHLGSVALSPRVSPDGSRVAFSGMGKSGWDIMMFSVDLNRLVSFPHFSGTNLSPAWSSDGLKLAFSSSRTGDPEIYVSNASGGELKRVTEAHGPDVSPVWNPKTNAQIAWVSGRTGLPQLYTMGADGTNIQRMTDQGYAVSPSWSPNGQFLAFAWIRKYGPGEPGSSDIYLMDVASKQWVQLTHDGGRNDFPSWSPDSRHIVFQSNRSGSLQIWTMLADGTNAKQLTTKGTNSQPNWSWK